MAQDIEQTLEDVKEFRKGLEDMLDKVDDVEAALDEAVGIQQQLQEQEDSIQEKDDRIYELESILEEELTAEGAAEKLLEGYTGHKPSLGDVQKLKGIIDKALVEQFGVSEGTL